MANSNDELASQLRQQINNLSLRVENLSKRLERLESASVVLPQPSSPLLKPDIARDQAQPDAGPESFSSPPAECSGGSSSTAAWAETLQPQATPPFAFGKLA